jgi:DNA polymerase III alpha subunit (gram-positive type)
MKLLIFDTETTGIENAELIEFGGLYFDASDTANDLDKQILIEEKRFRMKPDQPILPSSTVIHGITQKKADEWEPCFKVVPILHKFLMNIIDNEIVTFVGQNISYDVNVLNSSFKKYGLQEIHFQQFLSLILEG